MDSCFRLVKIVLLLFLSILSFAAYSASGTLETASSQPGSTTSPTSALPRCIEDGGKIAAIVDKIKTNSKTDFKYSGYRDELQSSTDTELVARLAYSETLAANCNDSRVNRMVAPRIVDVIANRIRLRNNGARSVIFQRDQFASSLNVYTESRYRDLLCPKDLTLWNTVLTEAKTALNSKINDKKFPTDAVQYYLFKHSARFLPPDWTKNSSPNTEAHFDGDQDSQACVKFYRTTNWR